MAAAAAQRLLAASTKIVGAGRNYISHAKDLGNPVLKEPVLFLKPTSSFLHAGPTAGPIEVPEPLESLHHEVELAVVISRRARDVPEASAMDFVGGYALALDMSSNDLQSASKSAGLPWTLGKVQDTFTPISAVVPKSAIANPYDLELWLKPAIKVMTLSLTSIEQPYPGTPPDGVGPVRVGQKINAGITDLIDVEFDVQRRKRSFPN
ncbi:Fumarylacetoacetate hydrolase domain-containing protein 1-like protein [Triticum urartu]|uniref:Fumarylacetoacetate hydrolase domain-containing protein 1-like protein n=1 Tax=Triticum urartu TaxID=4572 RepID=M8AUS1_TRIUA|nr:Fumarylacetoacetate hydrolase domain-containing protein 1-like protein [Triticum urartu]